MIFPHRLRFLVLVGLVGAMLQPAIANCSRRSSIPTCNRLISGGYSYVFTPGCENVECGSSLVSVTDDLVGRFWAIGYGDERPGVGNDNGTREALDDWLYIYPGFPVSLHSTWAYGNGTDGCIDHTGFACTAVLVMDRHPFTDQGTFMLLTTAPDTLGNYDFGLPDHAPFVGVVVPRLSITGSVAVESGVVISLDGISLTDIAPALYLDPACAEETSGDIHAVIQGYTVYAVVVPRGSGPPRNPSVESWDRVSDVVPLDQSATVQLACGESAKDAYLAAGLVFDSNYKTVYLSEVTTRVECGTNLSDPTAWPERKPRNREASRSRSRR